MARKVAGGDRNMMTPRNPRICCYQLLTLITCLFVLPAHAKYSGGTGEPNDPYQIATAEDLMLLGEDPNDYDKRFILIADIDLSAFDGKEGRPAFNIIGDSYEHLIEYGTDGIVRLEGTPFTGVFDGNGHTISHLTAVNAQTTCRGLFGGLASSGQILNMGVVDVNVTSSDGPVGSLVAYNHGTVTRCYSTGTVIGASDVGGLVGSNIGSISESYSSSAVSGTGENVGGLVGSNREEIVFSGPGMWGDLCQGRVFSAYSAGSVSGRRAVGGLVGDNSGGDVTQCYSTGLVSGTEDVGGLVGYKNDYSSVTSCFWDIQTSGQATSAGGTGKTTAEMQTAKTFLEAGWDFVGETVNGSDDIWKISEGLDYPRLSWQKYSGGTGEPNDPYQIATAADLIALGETPEDYDKHFLLTADIDLDPNLPGRKVFDKTVIAPDTNDVESDFQGTSFTGVFDGNGYKISHLTVTGGSYLGLFGSLASGAEVKDLGVADTNIVGSGLYVGGLVGYNNGGTVAQCYSTGAVSASRVGGMVGENYGTVTQSHSSGSVSGHGSVGGLVGWNGSDVTHCYSTGAVSGTSYVGGLAGMNLGGLTKCYSTGAVNGGGGLVGATVAKGAFGIRGWAIDCFWDIQTSGRTWSDGGTGKTTAEMQTAKTFLDAGWDFVGETANGTQDLWWINEGKDYPRLWWEAQ